MGFVRPKPAPAALFFVLSTTLLAQSSHPPIPVRLSEETEVLQQNAARLLTEETLVQRSLLPPLRFHPRGGGDAERSIGPRFRIREVVSEFTFAPLKDSPSPDLVEFRQVLSIDGHPKQSADTALQALSNTIRQADDRSRKRMLEQFARTGLVDIATDYALILLAFTSRGQKLIDFAPAAPGYVGADPAISFTWKQKTSQGGVVEFHGGQSSHRSLQGTLWLRASDGLPLRVSAWIEYSDAATRVVRDDAAVDYLMSEHGFLTPASVVHHHIVNGVVMTENLYRYQPFKFFSTSSTITFGSPK